MCATLRYRFVKCEKFDQSIIPKWKSNETIHEHKYYNDAEIDNFKKISESNQEMQLYVHLSIEIAPRI